jgi:23S rRNA pseudouridine2605 synthase
MLARLGHKVLTLKREAIGPVQLDRLPKGKARRLSGTELEELRQSVARRKRSGAEATNGDKPPAHSGRRGRPQRTRRP